MASAALSSGSDGAKGGSDEGGLKSYPRQEMVDFGATWLKKSFVRFDLKSRPSAMTLPKSCTPVSNSGLRHCGTRLGYDYCICTKRVHRMCSGMNDYPLLVPWGPLVVRHSTKGYVRGCRPAPPSSPFHPNKNLPPRSLLPGGLGVGGPRWTVTPHTLQDSGGQTSAVQPPPGPLWARG